MLPAQHKLTSSEEFRRTIRKGKRAGRNTAVVHVRINRSAASAPDAGSPRAVKTRDLASFGGPRCGLVVSKAVGNAVTRHHVSRLLRHVFLSVAPTLPPEATVVIRALPASASATYEELSRDVRAALDKALRR